MVIYMYIDINFNVKKNDSHQWLICNRVKAFDWKPLLVCYCFLLGGCCFVGFFYFLFSIFYAALALTDDDARLMRTFKIRDNVPSMRKTTLFWICLFVWGFSSHSRKFTHMEMSQLPVKDCNVWPLLSTHGHWAVRVLQRATPTVTYLCYLTLHMGVLFRMR